MDEDDEARSAERSKAERENTEREIADGDPALTRKERSQASDNRRLSALTVFAIIRREGEEELRRPLASLWWSGIAAGIGISTSVFAQGLLYQALDGHPQRALLASLGYTFGFALVILSRLQLFTENTLSVVLPILSEPSGEKVRCAARLWSIVLLANFVGTFATALCITLVAGHGPGSHYAAMLEVSHHAARSSGLDALVLGIPAGFFIAALVWMLPSSKGFELLVIVMFSWLIAAGGFAHIVAGSTEMFLLMLAGEMSVTAGIFGHLVPIFAGNVIGGTGLFAMLAYAQIHEELR